MEYPIKCEELYYFYLSLKAGLLGLDEYAERINDFFLADDGRNEILLELEFCTASLAETIATLKAYLFDKTGQLDYSEVGKLLIDGLKKLYHDDSVNLEELTHKLYSVWMLLPSEVSQKPPFIKLNSIDDSWAWEGKDKVIEDINWLLNYYND